MIRDKAELQRRIEGYAREWRLRLGLAGWVVDVLWTWKGMMNVGADKRRFAKHAKHFDEAQALSLRSEPNLTAELAFNLPRIRQDIRTDAELEGLVVHELLHVLAPALSEKATCTLANVLVTTRREARAAIR